MIDQHELEMRNLRDVMYAMELRFNERETEALQEFQGLIDELKNKVSALEASNMMEIAHFAAESGRDSCTQCSEKGHSR